MCSPELPKKPIREEQPVLQRVRTSIFPQDFQKPQEPGHFRYVFNTLLFHFRPRKVQERTLAFTLTFGLGGMAVVLVGMLFVTGILLKFIYQPVPDRAYESILHLQTTVPFGRLIRNIHHWSANILMLVAFLHFLRVFFTGAFHPPRQFNWIIGLTLLLMVLTSNLTGYLLPWDQLSFWAITICTAMLEYIPGIGSWLQALVRGGSDIGPATLSIFFALHTAVIPACLVLLLSFHFWRIRKAGGLVVPRSPEEQPGAGSKTVPSIPNLLVRELTVAAVLIAVIMVLSVLFDAPLAAKANSGLSPNPTKAPWYFAGLQELLLHFHPLFALFVIPICTVIGLVSIPYIRCRTQTSGVWFISGQGRRMAVAAALFACVATPASVVADELFIDLEAWMPGVSPVVTIGFFPVLMLVSGLVLFSWALKKMFDASGPESMQSLFVLLLTAFVLLTVTGIWFRGEGMALMWPWDMAG